VPSATAAPVSPTTTPRAAQPTPRALAPLGFTIWGLLVRGGPLQIGQAPLFSDFSGAMTLLPVGGTGSANDGEGDGRTRGEPWAGRGRLVRANRTSVAQVGRCASSPAAVGSGGGMLRPNRIRQHGGRRGCAFKALRSIRSCG